MSNYHRKFKQWV